MTFWWLTCKKKSKESLQICLKSFASPQNDTTIWNVEKSTEGKKGNVDLLMEACVNGCLIHQQEHTTLARMYLTVAFVSSKIAFFMTLKVLPCPGLRFLYNRLALVIHCDTHLSSIALPWQLFSVIKVVLVYQILHTRLWIPHGRTF